MSDPRPGHDPRKSRQNIVLALAHVLLVVVILAGFVYVQTRT
ncbi:hypothetical protein [Panacagrimonas sp.]